MGAPNYAGAMSSAQGPAAESDVSVRGSGSGVRFAAIAALGGAAAALVAALVVALSAAQALTLLGIPDPGPLTTYGLPAVRAVADFAAALTVGSLLFAAFFVPPQGSGVLDVGGIGRCGGPGTRRWCGRVRRLCWCR